MLMRYIRFAVATAVVFGIATTVSSGLTNAAAETASSSKPAPVPKGQWEGKRPAGPGAGSTATPDRNRADNVNRFNRLLTHKAARMNAPPAEDGIHDPANPGTAMLQSPAAAFRDLPKARGGNGIDWVKALESRAIHPRFDRDDPKVEPNILDLNIVREVKGSMPDVVYPHKKHTEWLDCSNCHDDIFVPQKGKNQISMAAILLGQKCGVCHGKVAFPVSDCRRCHSKPKTPEQLRQQLRNLAAER